MKRHIRKLLKKQISWHNWNNISNKCLNEIYVIHENSIHKWNWS
jgi:hypothetical protein